VISAELGERWAWAMLTNCSLSIEREHNRETLLGKAFKREMGEALVHIDERAGW
jgi:hypothetical protein